MLLSSISSWMTRIQSQEVQQVRVFKVLDGTLVVLLIPLTFPSLLVFVRPIIGAIAAATFACGINSLKVLDLTVEVSDSCKERGGARGRLLSLLREELYTNIGIQEYEVLNARKGAVAIAYREIFPLNRPILQTHFRDRDDLVNSVCYSSMFPFFATNWPCTVDWSNRRIPRLLVDGFFTVARDRFGCPDFHTASIHVDRTVTISVFPQQSIGLNASLPEDCICPEMESKEQMQRLLQIAIESSSRQELTKVFEDGWADAERWCQSQVTYPGDEEIALN